MNNRIKYPRTPHLPWSESISNDDRILHSIESFLNKEIVVTEKMDGECTTCYSDYVHARSVDYSYHPSRTWMKQFWSSFAHLIPIGWRVCGENLYAVHSIKYEQLPSYFMGFSIWNENNECLNWNETLEWFDYLGITSVPVLYKGLFDINKIKSLWNQSNNTEGYVIRLVNGFSYEEFKHNIGKFVRANHVQTDEHWIHRTITEKNLLAS